MNPQLRQQAEQELDDAIADGVTNEIDLYKPRLKLALNELEQALAQIETEPPREWDCMDLACEL